MRQSGLLLLTALVLLPQHLWAQPAARVPANGSFEQLDARTGLPAGWTVWNSTGNLTAFSLAMAHDGVACASVTDPASDVSQGLRSPRVPIQGGQTYTATGYVWIDDLKASAFALYLEFWKGDQRVADYSVSTTDTGRWAELQVQHAAPAEATEATVLVYGGSATIGHAYFDDITLK